MEMEDRITVLERDVDAIKSELAVIRHEQFDRANAVELIGRVSRIESDILEMKVDISQLQKDMAQVQKDVASLQKDVSQLQRDVAQLQKDMAQLQKDMMQFRAQMREENASIRQDFALLRADFASQSKELSNFASKADVIGVEGNIKGWMLGVAMTMVSVNFAMNVIFFNFQKEAAAIAAVRAQAAAPPVTPPQAPAPAAR